MTEQTNEYVTLGEAAERLGVDRYRLRVLMQRNGIKPVENPLDLRERLIAAADVERLERIIQAIKKAAA